jgi:Cdc6-like AAA superfamily ATPase
MFTGYTTEEVSAIVVKYQESKQNALAIQNQILKLYQGWVVFNTGILREDAVKYRLLKSAFDHADKVYQELNEKWTYTQITKDRAKQYKMSSARNARNAAERAIEKFLFGTADLMKMLKSIGLEVSKDQTTMIKGFHQQSGDFKVSRGDIDLYGFTGTSKFNEIIKMLNEAGYVIDHKSDPYRSPSTGMRASITVKMKHNPSLLADAHI